MDFYSYNGVELPDINEVWTDKETYPYAYIARVLSGYGFFAFKSPRTWNGVFTLYGNYYYTKSRGVWCYADSSITEQQEEVFGTIVWSNYDIYSTDGVLKLSASKPVPVGYGVISLADYEAACDAIRAKTGKAGKIKSGDMATEIESIPAGGGGPVTASKKEVNFYDYDGTLLHSYTVAEAQALSELPPLPTQNGLICQGWNYDLDTIKSYNRAVDVGATYITDDGKTRLYIKIAAEGRMDVPLYFSQTVANGVTIDWGDGSATETLSGTGYVNTVHTYASIGEYVITLDVADGCTLVLGHASGSVCVLGSAGKNGKVYCNMLQKVEIGNGVTRLDYYTFQYCYSLASIVIPNGITSIESNAFSNCRSLSNINIPDGVVRIGAGSFGFCYSLRSVVIPNSVNTFGVSAFTDCTSLASIVIPNGVTRAENYSFRNCVSIASILIPNGVASIGKSAFIGDTGIKFYDFTSHTEVPTLEDTGAFNDIPTDCEIRVPAALYDEWIAATNWSTYAANIVAV